MNASAAPAQIGEVVARETVDQLIARILGRAHRQAHALDAPSEARAILHVAHSFADELAAADPGFDRLRFIRNATEHP